MSAADRPLPAPLLDLIPEDLRRDLEAFFCARMDRLNPRDVSEDYVLLDETATRLFDRMEAEIAEDAGAKLSELAECYTNMAALATEMYYRLGFADGVRMAVGAQVMSPESRIAGRDARP